MLKITFGLWRSKKGDLFGSFTIFGKKFVVFINEYEAKKENHPECTVTIQESNDHVTQDRY